MLSHEIFISFLMVLEWVVKLFFEKQDNRFWFL